MKNALLRTLAVILLSGVTAVSNAQYFGQNKVKYQEFDFKVMISDDFEMYYYLDNDSTAKALIERAKVWRQRHREVFDDSLAAKIPLIFYNNHGDFQQTSVVGGLIGTTTGGVTEGFRNRVTMPLTASFAQTDHVLGHELVHAHQYNLFNVQDSMSIKNMMNIPLWMTEGLAEYMSIGNTDSHTSMWLRDAVLYGYFPALKDLNKSKYFPYRWGQAFWSFVGETFGDEKIHDLYLETGKSGASDAFKKVLSMPTDSFSKRWKEAALRHYKPLISGRDTLPPGLRIIDRKNGGRLNISPSVSPDGKYVIFLSEKNVFTLDLYLADTRNGHIIKRIKGKTHRTHMDALDAFQSSGTWSPDSKRFAYTGYSKGRSKLAIVTLPGGQIVDEFFVEGVPSIQDPAWSPKGNEILFTGLVQGQSDLFLVDVYNHRVRRLTHDIFAQVQPAWSPDGRYIAYVTDKRSPGAKYPSKTMSIALLEPHTGQVQYLPLFENADNLNPQFSPDGKSLYFLSDWDGYRDIYRYDFQTQKIFRETRLATGVSGITKFAKAISVSVHSDKLLYSAYLDSRYDIFKVSLGALDGQEVSARTDNEKTAAHLPSLSLKESIVNAVLHRDESFEIAATDTLTKKAYEPKFKLDYISSGGIGIATGRYGTGMAGGINMLFGDMMNDNQIYIGAMLNGELQDFGGQAAYLNRKHRLSWGGGLIHFPYRYYTYDLTTENVEVNGQVVNALKETYSLYRVFKEQASVFSYYPFSRVMRVEGGLSYNYYSFRLDKYNYYYTSDYPYYYLGEYRERNLDVAPSFGYMDISVAWVGDTSSFGLTSPMNGYRYRFEIQQSSGRLNMTSLLADVRGYHYVKPFTLAARAYQYSRLGESASDALLPPLYLGYETLVRGYTYKAFARSYQINSGTIDYTDLIGSKIIVANAEIRFPLTGPKRISAIKSGFLFTDLNLFFDSGMVWGKYSDLEDRGFSEAQFISSTGVSLRINLFGQLILEPYLAFPLQLEGNSQGVFGLNFTPGW